MSKKTSKTNNSLIDEESKTMPINIPDWSIWILFAVTTMIFFWNQLFGTSFFWEDFAEYIYPTQTLAAREFAKGIIPFWNHYIFSGMPFIADLQVGFFYPLNRLTSLFIDNDGILSIWFLQFLVILHFFIAQISTFYLARFWKISKLSSIITAISYSFSFIFVLHVIHPMMLYHLAWLPLVILYFDKSMTHLNLRYAFTGGLILGFSMLSGHPQTTLYQYVFIGFFFLWRLIFSFKNKVLNENLKIIKFALSIIILVGVSAGIFQIQFLQSKELANLSVRAEMNYEKSSEGSLEIKQISSIVVPKVYGLSNANPALETPFNLVLSNGKNAPHYYYWETGFYFGLVALLFGLFGAISQFKDEKSGFLVFISIFAFLYALGSNGFLHQIFFNFPLFNQFRNPARMLFFLIFGFSFLAGFGLDKFIENAKNNKTFIQFLIASAIPLFIAILVSAGMFSNDLPEQSKSIINGYGQTALFIILAILAIAFLINKKLINSYISIGLLAFITIIDTNLAGRDFNQSESNPQQEYELNADMKKLFVPNTPSDIYRVNMRIYNPPYMALKRNQGLVSNVMLIEGYNPLVLQKVNPPTKDIETLHDLLNVKYQLQIDSTKGMPVFTENKDMLAHAWMVYNYRIVEESQISALMKGNDIDYSKEVILENKPQIFIKNSNETVENKVTCIQYSSNSMKYTVNSKENGILCLSEVYYPAWKAYVNGKKVDILRANYSLRAIPVESGESVVELKYESSAFNKGMWIALLTVLVSIVGMIVLDRKKKE